jgi:hypothetical protein
VITLLERLFLENWLRKLLSLILAMIIWMVVNNSMTSTKVVQNVPVRVIHLPPGKTIAGMQASGILHERVILTLQGKKAALDEISEKDLEVVLDAEGKPNEWIAVIGKKEIVSLNPDFNPAKAISKVEALEKTIKQSRLLTEKIPIMVTQPIGEAPKGYQYLDVYPPQLGITVTGPEEAVKRLKARGGLKLTFNLADISKLELDTLQASGRLGIADEISYFVPNSWKKISIPTLSETPIEIDDSQAKGLRIVFSRQDLLPIGTPIPVTVFFPQKNSNTLNPETCLFATDDFIVSKNGVKMITAPLFAQGISNRFLELVQDRIQLVIVAAPKTEREHLLWNVQLIYPSELEDRFVAKMISEFGDEVNDIQPHLREDFLRNRFRSYMDRFRLYTPNNKKLHLDIILEENTISVMPENYP